MRLTPLEIRKQEFHRSMRGFDVDEVEMFLDMVAEQFETLLRERNALNEEVVKLRTQLRDYQQVEKTLQETLMNAQQNLNESREASRRQAEL
ncbi:MAG: DivIVA domain-containing protein, partial [candidate division KSB1 bacterium]|nr:DivIVA domain-containing protein [candidate division KSB1 bacterium]